MVGTVVAKRFHVKRLLATGGLAKVYVARDSEGERRVALKIIEVQRSEHVQVMSLVEREVAALGELDHPHIANLIASGTLESGGLFIAQELVSDARSITQYVREKKLTKEACLRLVDQLIDALEHVHSRGWIHCDLKSSNLLITDRDGPHLMLVDFGIARRAGAPALAAPLLGGAHTTSPEQIRGEHVDQRADIYSLGVLLFRLLAGRYPFHSKVVAEVFGQHLNAEIPSLPEELPDGLNQVVHRCLAKDPEDRFPNVGAVREGLAEIPPSRRRLSNVQKITLVLVLAIVVLAVLYGLFG